MRLRLIVLYAGCTKINHSDPFNSLTQRDWKMGKNNRARSRHKKRNTKKKKTYVSESPISSLGPAWSELPNPFASLDDNQRQILVKELDENSEKAYNDSLAKILEILEKHDPFVLLSILSSYGLTVGVSDHGVTEKDSDHKIHQAHVEILQGLALHINPSKYQYYPPTPDIVQDLWDAITSLLDSLHLRGLSQHASKGSDQEKAISFLQYRIRGNTTMVRNWGYFSQVVDISRELYSNFDDGLRSAFGFSAVEIIECFLFLIRETESANTKRFNELSMLRKQKNKSLLVEEYHKLIGQGKEQADRFVSSIDIHKIPYDGLFSILMSHYDLRLNDNYTFNPSQIAKGIGIEEESARSILSRFSHRLGDLQSFNVDHLFLSNPIWLRPAIQIGDDAFFCPMPQAFFSFAMRSLDPLVEEISKEWLSDVKADYLENKVAEIIARRFPNASTVSSITWQHNGKQYETDLITFIDSHAIIVEAKSGKISDPALRGAPERLKRHIDDILVEPNIQSKRLEEKLIDLSSRSDPSDDILSKIPVDISKIKKVIRVSVSLDDFASIQANIANLKDTGWLPPEFEPCPTMNVADFETLFDFLDHPIQIIHYLQRRQEIEKQYRYVGDELDLMGLYIGTLFNFGDIDFDRDMVITGMSQPLDRYYNSKNAGIVTQKPRPKISSLFSGIFSQLEARHTERWTEIGVILSRFSPDDQRLLEKHIQRIKKNVRKNWRIDGHNNTVVYIPPKASEFSLCYVVYNGHNEIKRRDFAEVAAIMGLEPDHVKQCLVIAKNMDDHELNYNIIALAEHPD